MDINQVKKPIHIRCPHCKKDLQYNVNSIKTQKDGMIAHLNSLNRRKLEALKKEDKARLDGEIRKTMFKLKLLSEDMNMLNASAEYETLKIFKRKVRKMIGDEVFMQLIKESEEEYLEENTFN